VNRPKRKAQTLRRESGLTEMGRVLPQRDSVVFAPRRPLPRGTDLALHSQAKLSAIRTPAQREATKDIALSNLSRQVRRVCCSDQLNPPFSIADVPTTSVSYSARPRNLHSAARLFGIQITEV
jgi:hypothetical protein